VKQAKPMHKITTISTLLCAEVVFVPFLPAQMAVQVRHRSDDDPTTATSDKSLIEINNIKY
jgi:hypothetical protein